MSSSYFVTYISFFDSRSLAFCVGSDGHVTAASCCSVLAGVFVVKGVEHVDKAGSGSHGIFSFKERNIKVLRSSLFFVKDS